MVHHTKTKTKLKAHGMDLSEMVVDRSWEAGARRAGKQL